MSSRKSHLRLWFEAGCPFDEGVRLFVMGGGSGWKLRYIQRKGDARPRIELLQKELGDELEQLRRTEGDAPNRPVRVASTQEQLAHLRSLPKSKKQVVSLFERTIPIEDLPENLRDLRMKQMNWYYESEELHSQLEDQQMVTARVKIALSILDLWELIDRAWKEIDYWVLHGDQMPEEKDEDPEFDKMSVAEMKLLKKNYDSYLCKHYPGLRKLEAKFRAEGDVKERAKLGRKLGRKRKVILKYERRIRKIQDHIWKS